MHLQRTRLTPKTGVSNFDKQTANDAGTQGRELCLGQADSLLLGFGAAPWLRLRRTTWLWLGEEVTRARVQYLGGSDEKPGEEAAVFLLVQRAAVEDTGGDCNRK